MLFLRAMASKKIIYSKQALADLRSVEQFLFQYSQAAARSVVLSIHQTISNLHLQPNMGVSLKSLPCRMMVDRRYKYVIVYQVQNDKIHIRFIFHSRQQPPL